MNKINNRICNSDDIFEKGNNKIEPFLKLNLGIFDTSFYSLCIESGDAPLFAYFHGNNSLWGKLV